MARFQIVHTVIDVSRDRMLAPKSHLEPGQQAGQAPPLLRQLVPRLGTKRRPVFADLDAEICTCVERGAERDGSFVEELPEVVEVGHLTSMSELALLFLRPGIEFPFLGLGIGVEARLLALTLVIEPLLLALALVGQ
jgi:hypothetical protein